MIKRDITKRIFHNYSEIHYEDYNNYSNKKKYTVAEISPQF